MRDELELRSSTKTMLRYLLIGACALLAVFVVWPLTVALTAPPNSELERPYLVIAETTSPNGQYAVAWTLPKGPQIDWEKFRSGERSNDYLPDLDNPKSDVEVEDSLIELKSGRKLAAVALG